MHPFLLDSKQLFHRFEFGFTSSYYNICILICIVQVFTHVFIFHVCIFSSVLQICPVRCHVHLYKIDSFYRFVYLVSSPKFACLVSSLFCIHCFIVHAAEMSTRNLNGKANEFYTHISYVLYKEVGIQKDHVTPVPQRQLIFDILSFAHVRTWASNTDGIYVKQKLADV